MTSDNPAATFALIDAYLQSQPDAKRADLLELHSLLLSIARGAPLSFLDGRDETGRVVTNPNIGYGRLSLVYADGSTKEFYQIGMSANTSGISLYFMGLKDKTFLAQTYGASIGKAKVTGYCIQFRRLSDLNRTVLETALKTHWEGTLTP